MKILKTLLLLVLALLVGAGIAVYRIADFERSDAFFHNGSWMGSKNLPLGKDPLLTTQITVFALFALPSEEAIYLFAKRDRNNEIFNSSNDYTISGNIHQISAKYWSITAYGSDLYLMPNTLNRFGFNNSNIKTDSLGNFTISVSHQPRSGNWLPTPDHASFNLVLRIYKGNKHLLERLDTTSLPEITLTAK